MAKCNTFAGTNRLDGIGFELFTIDELKDIHAATMEILMNPGIKVDNDDAIKIFKEGGCIVDEKTRIVKIPEYVVRKALQTAPSRFTLWGRNKKYNTVMECGKKVHWTCFGTGVNVTKYISDTKYKTVDSSEQDIVEIAKLCDWAEEIDYFSLPVAAREYAGKGAQDVHELFTSISSTEKHFNHIDPVGPNLDVYWNILKAYYGGDEDEARDKPLLSMAVCPTCPLELSYESCISFMKGANYGIPINSISMAMSAATSPIYLAGTLITHNAEVLSGIVLSQLTCPGAPNFYGSSTTIFDIKKATAPVGAPELAIISASVAKLGQFYGLPTFVAGA